MRTAKSKAPAIWAFFGGAALLLISGFAAFYFFVGKPAVDAASAPIDRFVDALEKVTQRKVETEGSTVVLEESGVSEFAVVQRKIQSLIKYETRWLASDNILIVRGEFIAKAGFDLSKVVKLKMVDGTVEGVWPEPEILSVELVDYDVFFSQNGVVNKLTPKDQEDAIRRLLQQARKDALESDLREEAQRRLRERLEDLGQGDFELGEQFLP